MVMVFEFCVVLVARTGLGVVFWPQLMTMSTASRRTRPTIRRTPLTRRYSVTATTTWYLLAPSAAEVTGT